MNFQIDHNSRLPLHVQVEDLIRNLLTLPEYANGALLPKEVELANQLGVSRSTIRQAANKLEHEGLLKRKKGVGTTAAPQKVLETSLDHWYSFTQEMKERGILVNNLFVKAEFVPANPKIALFFNINEGREVLKLSKLKGTDNDPIVYFESYFHPRIGLTKEEDFEIPLYSMLEAKYGVKVVRSSENIKAILASEIAPMLQISKNEPVLYRERYVYDPGNRPIEFNVGYYRSDKFTYSIDIKKSS